jgi:NADPH:quinone reductase-like Zn-dependent oxidoreductase
MECIVWHAAITARTDRAHLGSGGVSLFALQFAKVSGARVIVTTSSDEKAVRLKALGADDVINYRTTSDWPVAVRDLTHGRGVDQVVDIGGGTLEQSCQCVVPDGQVNFIGRLSDRVATINVDMLFRSVATIRVVFAGSRSHFIAMNRAISVNRLRPVIDRVFPFEEALEAFRYYETGNAFGRVVIRHRPTSRPRSTVISGLSRYGAKCVRSTIVSEGRYYHDA